MVNDDHSMCWWRRGADETERERERRLRRLRAASAYSADNAAKLEVDEDELNLDVLSPEVSFLERLVGGTWKLTELEEEEDDEGGEPADISLLDDDSLEEAHLKKKELKLEIFLKQL